MKRRPFKPSARAAPPAPCPTPAATPPPLRFVLQSYDKLCHLSMQIQWTDEFGQRQKWNSWKDALCGYYEATKLLPAESKDIEISFRSMPGKHRARKVDRRNRCAWAEGDEVIHLRRDGRCSGTCLDVVFEMRGPLLHCYIWRAWNKGNTGVADWWEHWPDFPRSLPLEPPCTLKKADAVAPWAGSRQKPQEEVQDSEDADHVERVADAMARLRAAAEAMLEVRQQTRTVLQKLDKQLKKQWYRVNSTNTVAAGLAVASFATIFTVPPVGVALGVGSAAAGASATGGDVVGDHIRGSKFARAVQLDLYEQLGFAAVEGELQRALQSAVTIVHASHGEATSVQAGRFVAWGAQTASVAAFAMRQGVRASRAVVMTRAGQGVSAAGKIFGAVGAGLAVGVAVHGWSTTKPTQQMVKDKLMEVERSIEYLNGLVEHVTGALQCGVCKQRLQYGRDEIRRCQQFHCFHAACLQDSVNEHGNCPLCPQADRGKRLQALGNSVDRLRAMLWLSGIKDVALNLESLGPQILSRGRELIAGLSLRVKEDGASQILSDILAEPTPQQPLRWNRSAGHLPEDADGHEAWQLAVEAAGSLEALESRVLDDLLATGMGMPLKYRHKLWPQWLRVVERRQQAQQMQEDCRDFATLATTLLPADVQAQIENDIPRVRPDLLAEDQHDSLRRLLVAVVAHNPEVGYAQGMHQLAGVFLKMGFEEEVSFWMLVEVLEKLIPGCHAPDLNGLFRDMAVSDVLVQTFLPGHAATFTGTGIQSVWLTGEFFVTLGTKSSSLALVARLWDFAFLHGPCGLFSSLLAYLELFFPVPTDCGAVDSEDLLLAYRSATHNGDAEIFAQRVLRFLHERHGGVSADLITGLRASLGQPYVSVDCLPPHVLAQGRELLDYFTARAREELAKHEQQQAAQQAILELIRAPVAAEVESVRRAEAAAMPESAEGCLEPTGLGQLPEDGECLAAWQEALDGADSLTEVDVSRLDQLLTRAQGMPQKFRHVCWPHWLQSSEEVSPSKCTISADAHRQIVASVDQLKADVVLESQREELQQLLLDMAVRSSNSIYTEGMSHLAAVCLKLGFTKDAAVSILEEAVQRLTPGVHTSDLHGLFRDIAVADVLVQTFLPQHATTMAMAGIPLLWLAADFFLALGAKDLPLPLAARLLDLCFLHGPAALFCGLLAHLELHFPVRSTSRSLDVMELLASCRRAAQFGDPEAFAVRLLQFLRERQGGVSAELVEELRAALLERDTCEELPISPHGASTASSSDMALEHHDTDQLSPSGVLTSSASLASSDLATATARAVPEIMQPRQPLLPSASQSACNESSSEDEAAI